MIRFAMGAALALALGACASASEGEPRAAFDPAACYERAFEIYFDEYAADLSPEAAAAINAVEESLSGCRITRVRILGLAGARGTENDNRDISIRRAQVIGDYLERTTRWPRSAFELLAAGESGATLADGTPELMRRRAHITVTTEAP